MIDEKKLIEKIWNIFSETYNNAFKFDEDESKLVERVMIDVQHAIEEQPQIGGWIPCSERLPEESEFYMVTKKIKETGNRFTGKSRFDIEKGWNDSLDFVDIVAWQPLLEEYHG